MSLNEYISVNLTAAGRVQGVGFRYFVWRLACTFGVGGSVKNNFDGSVSIRAYGLKVSVLGFIRSVKQGSRYAVVEELIEDEHVKISKPESTEFYIAR